MRGLAGKTAIVTGGGSGLGAACAARLAAEGAAVAVVDRRADAAEAVATAITAQGGHTAALRCDVTRDDDIARMADQCASELGGPHLLVNSAGIAPAEGGVTDCAPEQWNSVMAVNLRGTFLTARHVLPYLITAGGGAVVNLSSVFGFRGLPGECAYAASKAYPR